MKGTIFFDARWKGAHGIGRFADEISRSQWLSSRSQNIQGPFDNIFSILDPLRLDKLLLPRDNWFISPSYNCPAFHSSRCIITLHDLMHIRFPEYASLKNRFYYEAIVKSVCKNAPIVFTVSEFSKSEISDWAAIPPEKIIVTYNGVEQRFNNDVIPLHRSKPYFLFVGDKKPHKNIHRLIRAYAASALAGEVDLLFSGKPDSGVIQQARELRVERSIKFAGFIPESELPAYYKGARAVLIPSLYEGFGLPLLEGMAVGAPVLAARQSALPEIAQEAALLVNPYNVEEIANGLRLLHEDDTLRQHLSVAGPIRAASFSWEKARSTWDHSLREILGS
jgi:glycosyltransferase involved in cell wall biosynthesis